MMFASSTASCNLCRGAAFHINAGLPQGKQHLPSSGSVAAGAPRIQRHAQNGCGPAPIHTQQQDCIKTLAAIGSKVDVISVFTFCGCSARHHVSAAGHPPNNSEFRALMLAATEAAMHDSTAGKRASLAAADLPRGFSAVADAAATGPGAGNRATVIGPDGCLAPVDLHGLSSAEARAAVLTTLSQLQVISATCAVQPANYFTFATAISISVVAPPTCQKATALLDFDKIASRVPNFAWPMTGRI